jgi:hypothetical protein
VANSYRKRFTLFTDFDGIFTLLKGKNIHEQYLKNFILNFSMYHEIVFYFGTVYGFLINVSGNDAHVAAFPRNYSVINPPNISVINPGVKICN